MRNGTSCYSRRRTQSDVSSSIGAKFRAASRRSDNLAREHVCASMGFFESDSVQTRAMCPISLLLFLSLCVSLRRWRTIGTAESTSSGLVPSLLLLHDFAFLRDEMEDKVPTATPIPPSLPPRFPFVRYLGDPEGHADSAVGSIRKCSPSDYGGGEFPGQESRNRYRLRNRGLRIADPTDPPTESVSSALA